jgi:ribosome-binding factor A
MAGPSYPRARRLGESIRRLVGEWLETEEADKLAALVTVTDVRVTPDLRHAKVFYTVLGDQDEVAATVAKLTAATGQARTWVAQRVRLRYAPTLEFISDDVPGRGARIDRLLAELGGGARGQAGPSAVPEQERPEP